MRRDLNAVIALGAVLAAMLAGVGVARAQAVTLGPYLQSPEGDAPDAASIVVVWEHRKAATAVVRHGETEALERVAKPAAAARRHELRLTGLTPGRTWYYALFAEDGTRLTETRAFPTPPRPGQSFKFVLFGDTRSRPDAHRKVIETLGAEPGVRFYVNTGDLVGDGGRASQWKKFFAVEADLMGRLPLFPAVGNHDDDGGEAEHFERLFALPDGETYYSVDYGNVHLVVLDGYVHVKSAMWCASKRGTGFRTCFDDEQTDWLTADLAQASTNPAIQHIVVVTHEGPYSSLESRSGSAELRALLPLFAETGVSLIVSGHDHLYERGRTGNGIPYVITGGGGAPLYTPKRPSRHPHEVARTEVVPHYVLVAVDGPLLTVSAKKPDGTVVDAFSIGRREPPLAAPAR